MFEADHINGPWAHPDDYKKLIGVARYTQPLAGGKWSLTGMAYDGTWNATDQIPERAVADGTLGRFSAVDPSDAGRSHRYSLSSDFQTMLRGGTLNTTAYAIQYSLDLFSDFTYFLNDPIHGDQIEQADNRTIYGWNGSWAKVGEFGGLAMTNTFGWDVRDDHVWPSGLYHTEKQQRLATIVQDHVHETSGSLFYENQTQWNDWLRTIAGARVMDYAFNVAANVPANSGSGTSAIGLPKLSVVIGPFAESEIFVNAGEGIHSNDVRGATEHVDPNSGSAVDPVTPLVRGIGSEIGLRTQRIPHLQTSLSFWTLRLGSELVYSGDDGTTVPGRPSMRTGAELSNHYTPNRWLLLDLDLATTRARYTDYDPVGEYIPEALRATVAAGVTAHDVGRWTTSLFMRYFGPRALTENDSVQSPSTTLFNTQTSYRLSKDVSVRFDIFNLFNAQAPDITYYYTSRLPGEPAAGVTGLHFHPVESREARLGLAAAF